MTTIETGKQAPGFSLPDAKGGTVGLKDFAGGKLALFFYPKAGTEACNLEIGNFNALLGDFKAAGTAVLGISPDPAKKLGRFCGKHELVLSLASDEDHAIAEAYGIWVEKSMYGRKFMGVERTTLLIDAKGRIARVWNKVKVPGHAQAVLEAAREL